MMNLRRQNAQTKIFKIYFKVRKSSSLHLQLASPPVLSLYHNNNLSRSTHLLIKIIVQFHSQLMFLWQHLRCEISIFGQTRYPGHC